MTFDNLLKSLYALISENIHKTKAMERGMFNFYFHPQNNIFRGNEYNGEMIFQTFPNKDNENYGSAYILMKNKKGEKEFFDWKLLNEEEKIRFAKDIINDLLFDYRINNLKWVVLSDDGAYEDESKEFSNWKDCYNDMRINAIDKVKWNTEPIDIENGFDYIKYEMIFDYDFVAHMSYSGLYVYLIVPYYVTIDDVRNDLRDNGFEKYRDMFKNY